MRPPRARRAPVHPGSRLLEQTAGTVTGRRSLEPLLWSAVGLIAFIAVLLILLPGRRSGREHGRTAVSVPTATAAIASGASGTVLPHKLYLEIEALDDTWVLVRTDASPQKKAVLKRGETVTWSASERFLLSYGGIGSAALRLNGRELVVAGPKDKIVRDLAVTADGIAAQKIEAEPRLRTPKAEQPPAAPAPPPRREPVRGPADAPASPGTAAQPAPAPEAVTAPAGQPAPQPSPLQHQE